jgi:hypothetical protein
LISDAAVNEGSIDQLVFTTLDQAPYALSMRELTTRVQQPQPIVAAALERLVAAGRVKITADIKTRAYYTKNIHLM